MKTILRAMWTKTRIEMTRANALDYASAVFSLDRDAARVSLERLEHSGFVMSDGTADSALLLLVGETRSAVGPRSVDDAMRLDRLEREAALAVPQKTPKWLTVTAREAEPLVEQKSVLASGALSLVLGPMGWLYSAPIKEAVPAMILFSLAVAVANFILPGFIASALMGAMLVASALVGMAYTARYNRTGKRTTLLEASNEPPRAAKKR